MNKIRNILISCIICIFLCGPTMLFATQRIMHVDVPIWFSSEEARYLAGGVNDVNVKASLSPSGFASGNLQESLETEMANFIPCKATALLFNAASQRNFIALSNELFKYDCYPTFYDSECIFIPAETSIMRIPEKRSNEWDNAFLDFMNSAIDWSQRHPETEVVITVIGSGPYSALNPAYKYVSDSLTYEDITKMQGNSAHNVTFIYAEYSNYSEYYEDFFKTDHHWNMRGAYKSYKKIASALDLPSHEDDPRFTEEEAVFIGSYDRSGLMHIMDNVPLLMDNYSMLHITDNRGSDPGSINYTIPNLASNSELEYNYASYCYGGLSNSTIVGGEGSKKVLLVADSFEEAIQRMLAKACDTLYSRYYLHNEDKNSLSLSDCLTEDPSDAVIYIGIPQDYASFSSRHPNWFD